jgi:Protein of unknown function (DUF3307)
VPWDEVFIVFFISHLVGDYLFQTDWQATNKHGGLGSDPERRAALLSHIGTYTLAYLPAFIWLADDLGGWTIVVALAVAVPHLIQDDGRLVGAYAWRVKKCDARSYPFVMAAVDQSFHFLALFFLALAAGS